MKRFNKVLFLLLTFFVVTACGNTNSGSDANDTSVSSAGEDTAVEETNSSSDEDSTAQIEDASRQVYVDALWIKDVMEGNNEEVDDYVIAEVTWGEAEASPDYLKKHIPNAIHMNTDSIEEGPVWNIKEPAELEQAFLDYGVNKDTTLILYGPDTGVDRMAYTALYLGVEDVKVLDGGLPLWESAGFKTEDGEVEPTSVTEFGTEVPANPQYFLSLDETVDEMENNENFRLVSMRSENEWLGIESGYSYIPTAGEPKGAVWGRPLLRDSNEANVSDMEDYKNEDGTNKDFEEIVAMWESEGFDVENDLSFYCGTGWRSCLPWLLMYENGYEATMYDGGWNEWQMNDELPVQIGDPKSDEVFYTTVGELEDGKETIE